MLKINQPAPGFILKDSDGNDVSLSSYAGSPVVILFFPLAFTGVCTKELCSVRDSITVYNNAKATVLAISVDSFFTLAQFKKQQNLNFSLLSDFNKEVSQAYGAYYDEFFGMHGVSKRAAFVINSEQQIVYAEVLDKASDLPNFDVIQETLNKIG
jgi:glutaredoxin-dependent peroxiredoxin